MNEIVAPLIKTGVVTDIFYCWCCWTSAVTRYHQLRSSSSIGFVPNWSKCRWGCCFWERVTRCWGGMLWTDCMSWEWRGVNLSLTRVIGWGGNFCWTVMGFLVVARWVEVVHAFCVFWRVFSLGGGDTCFYNIPLMLWAIRFTWVRSWQSYSTYFNSYRAYILVYVFLISFASVPDTKFPIRLGLRRIWIV